MYKSEAGAPGGIAAAILKPSSLSLTWKGVWLDITGLPVAQQDRVTVQLHSRNAACWTTEFPAPALRTSAAQFKDRAR